MKNQSALANHSIRCLQTMLRTISQTDNGIPAIIPDGVYGRETGAAVAEFQRSHALPITGVTDQETWETLVHCYENAVIEIMPAQPIQITLCAGKCLKKGERSSCIFLAQSMLKAISEHYHCICCPEINGILDEATQASLEGFQGICALPVTGNLDKLTWKQLALQYSCAVSSENNMSNF